MFFFLFLCSSWSMTSGPLRGMFIITRPCRALGGALHRVFRLGSMTASSLGRLNYCTAIDSVVSVSPPHPHRHYQGKSIIDHLVLDKLYHMMHHRTLQPKRLPYICAICTSTKSAATSPSQEFASISLAAVLACWLSHLDGSSCRPDMHTFITCILAIELSMCRW